MHIKDSPIFILKLPDFHKIKYYRPRKIKTYISHFFFPGKSLYGFERHKRSYESRHKGKENVSNRGIKPTGNKGNVFATENCTVVVAQVGGTATLPCVVRKFNTGVVSKYDIYTVI